ncbi:MAG: universal stress protein [Gammaproteobacteria bacterium]
MKGFKNMLYVIEPGVTQQTNLARAVSLAENNQARLTLIDVLPNVSNGLAVVSGRTEAERVQAALLAERTKRLESLCAPYRQRLEMGREVVMGKRFLEVIRTVLRGGYDLVIKPVENPSWTQRLFGSDDMHLLRKCPVPVWLMRPEEKSNYECIVAAVDFDPQDPLTVQQGLTREILDLASGLALSDFADLHLVHAWDAPEAEFVELWSDTPEAASSGLLDGEYLRHQRGMELLREQLEEQLGRDSYDYLTPHFHMLRGTATTVIPELARQLHADLVVMGTVGRSGTRGLLMGNTAESILEQLQCSVLAIKPQGFVSPVTLEA